MSSHEDDPLITERLRLIIDGTLDYAIFMLDPDGIIQTWNAGAQKIKGYESDEVIGRHFSMFYVPEAIADRHPEQVLSIARNEGHFLEEGWRQRKDGSRFWASVTVTALRDGAGELRGFSKVTRDLSDRKAAEDALRRAEELFRLAFDAAPTGMAIVTLDGRWTRVNDAMCRVIGRDRNDLLQSRVDDVLDLSAGDLEKMREGIAPEQDLRLARADGSEAWVHVGVGLLGDASGNLSQLIMQLEDVSTRIAQQEALLDAEQAKSRFVAVASHELRSPLTAILGYASMLHRRWDEMDDARKRDAVATMERQGRRLRLLVEDLLTLSSLEADGMKLNRRDVVLSDLLAEVLSGVEPGVVADGDLDVVVSADPLRLSQILTNLLVNAHKYGRPPIELTVATVGDTVEVVVSDHGEGIPAGFVPRMFDRFTQADEGLRRRSQGTGLGLAIVKTLADAHGAKVSYRDTPGGGATFVLTLPTAV